MSSVPTALLGRSTEASTTRIESLGLYRAALWVLLGANLLAGWGVQWDIMWHVLLGRDSFWIPPHVMTYGGGTGACLPAARPKVPSASLGSAARPAFSWPRAVSRWLFSRRRSTTSGTVSLEST